MRAHRIRPKPGIRRDDLLVCLMALADAVETDATIRDRLDLPHLLAALLEPSAASRVEARKGSYARHPAARRMPVQAAV